MSLVWTGPALADWQAWESLGGTVRSLIEAGNQPARTSRGERYAMDEDSTVVRFRQPEEIDDPLTAVLRSGARRLLAQAIEAEAEAFLALMADRQLDDGRARFVRHGRGPERTVQTGIGPVAVQRVKVRDRGVAGAGEAGSVHLDDPAALVPAE